MLSQKSQWPRRWAGQNPLHGGNTFENMDKERRVRVRDLRSSACCLADLGSSSTSSAPSSCGPFPPPKPCKPS